MTNNPVDTVIARFQEWSGVEDQPTTLTKIVIDRRIDEFDLDTVLAVVKHYAVEVDHRQYQARLHLLFSIDDNKQWIWTQSYKAALQGSVLALKSTTLAQRLHYWLLSNAEVALTDICTDPLLRQLLQDEVLSEKELAQATQSVNELFSQHADEEVPPVKSRQNGRKLRDDRVHSDTVHGGYSCGCLPSVHDEEYANTR